MKAQTVGATISIYDESGLIPTYLEVIFNPHCLSPSLYNHKEQFAETKRQCFLPGLCFYCLLVTLSQWPLKRAFSYTNVAVAGFS